MWSELEVCSLPSSTYTLRDIDLDFEGSFCHLTSFIIPDTGHIYNNLGPENLSAWVLMDYF